MYLQDTISANSFFPALSKTMIYPLGICCLGLACMRTVFIGPLPMHTGSFAEITAPTFSSDHLGWCGVNAQFAIIFK